jgi:hypothetical protein
MENDTTTQEAPMTTMTVPTSSGSGTTETQVAAPYQRPDWFTRHIFNRAVAGLTRLGVSVWGSRVLEHRGRTTGELHHTPVNLLTIEGTEYLVAPRGETQWVRNVRSSGGHMVLILGRRRRICTAGEVAPADSIEVLRAYLRKWKFETGMFFDGITPDAGDDEWLAVAARHPVFVLR